MLGGSGHDTLDETETTDAPSPSLAITDGERALAEAGDAQGFWDSRKAKGDPVADIALKSLNPPGGVLDSLFGGQSVNSRLEAFSRVYTGHSADQEKIRRELMQAHIEAVKNDSDGTHGLLDPRAHSDETGH
ncbi:hypothetical protein JCM17960_25380 [Magnetospira thiophila]